ncbi:MAG: cytochrome c oxidase subunit 3 [Gammaproteobacteria bacterium]
MTNKYEHYYVPAQSVWPIVGAIGLFLFAVGAAKLMHVFNPAIATPLSQALMFFIPGVLVILFMVSGWFNHVVHESMQGLYSKQMDHSFRYGMMWFIFSEVMFFAAFFGALFYIREFSVPWLGGHGAKGVTSTLWPHFEAMWPLMDTPNPDKFPAPHEVIGWKGIPLLNTIILLSSGVTVTWAHWALKVRKRTQLNIAMLLTVLLGAAFLTFQVHEYREAYHHLGLTLHSGVFGSTFFMLTGFHGMHVTLGTIMLLVILFRCMKGHFTPEHHFAFEAVAWYWHFVDVVWLGLFFFVYVL